MIETSLALSGSKERYDRKIDAALIVAITPAGMEEIRVMTGTQPAAPANLMEKNNLALEYLRMLDNSNLPVLVSERGCWSAYGRFQTQAFVGGVRRR
jgi:hypothetical protein